MEPRRRDRAVRTRLLNLRTSSHCCAPATEPLLQSAGGVALQMQPPLSSPPQDIVYRPRQLLPAEIFRFAREQLRHQLLAHVGETAGPADHALDACAIGLCIAYSQRSGQPRVPTLD